MLLVHIAATVPVSLAPIVAARLKHARIVLSLHDFYPHTSRYPKPWRGLERWFYRAAYRHCDLIIANNDVQSRRLIAEAKVPSQRVRTLFHGPFVVAGLTHEDSGAALRLLVFGALRPNKRVLETIVAVRQLRAGGVPVRLRIAGAPRREDAAYWARCLAEIPAGDPGFEVQPHFIADDELAGVLSGVAAVVCPYVGFDSQSGVAVTAVSNALPVIGTAAVRVAHVDLAACPWPQVADGADAAAIAVAVRRFIEIPAPLRQSFAVDAQARFLAAAGWDSLAVRIVAAMRERKFWG